MRILKFCFFMWFVMLSHGALAAPNFPELSGRVVDEAGILSGDRKQNIITQLEAFEAKSSAQIVVAVVNSLEGYEIRDYGVELARFWALGQADENNGVLLLIAPNERKVSIEVGYGLEGSLTDALSFQIIQQHILPQFKAGNMGAGIERGVEMILQGLAGEISEQSLMSNGQKQDVRDIVSVLFLFLFISVVIFIISRMFGSGGSGSGGVYTGSSSSSSRSSWGGGSSFSGGGGSFGGGGASGGW